MPAAQPTIGDRLLIVNADDLGYTAGINAGIFEAHRRGLVTSATLMVGFPAAEDAARHLPRVPELGVGLHVALTGGRPILPAEQVPSLVDRDGRLARRPEDFGVLDASQVLAEVKAQLERFRQLTGRRPTHLDSHHHAHCHPVVLEAVMTVAREEHLPVRSAAPEVGHRLLRAGLATTDHFVDSFFGDGATLASLLGILDRLPPGTTELMCHPARLDDALRRTSSYIDARARELEVLTSTEARRAASERGILLTHFGAL